MAQSRSRAAVAPLLLVIAGACLLRAETLTWAAADRADGTRFKLAPTVLAHVLQPARTDSPTVDCGFDWLRGPGTPLCRIAPGAAADAARQLSTAAHVLLAAGLWAIAAALLLLRPGQPRARRVLAAAVPGVLAVVATALFQPAALQLLTSVGALNGGFGGIGWYLVHLAPVLAWLAAVLEWQRGRLATAPSPAAAVLGIAAVLACVLLLVPRPLGNSVALLSSVAGLAVGFMLVVEDALGRQLRPRTPA